jgi:hypothetical protein
MLRVLFFTFLAICMASCNSEVRAVKSAIDKTYFGFTKMDELQKEKEDIYSIPVHPTRLKEYVDVNVAHEFVMTRYIFTTNGGVYRTFYIIDLTESAVILKDNEFSAFYEPIAKELLGGDVEWMRGDNTVELMKF